jgi:hypothetical protein
MQTELSVLRAIVRLSRRRSPVTLQALTLRGGGTHGDTIRALRFLAREGLIQATERGFRPTLPGLAIAVASARVARKNANEHASAHSLAAKNAKSDASPRSLKVDRSRRAA